MQPILSASSLDNYKKLSYIWFMKKYLLSIVVSLISFITVAQIPQNINPGTENKESMWDSPTTIIVVVVFIILLIVSRTWSKRILRKRDEISKRDKHVDGRDD